MEAQHGEKRTTGNSEYAGFARRILRAMSRRVGTGDIAALPELVKLQTELDAFIEDAVRDLRTEEGGAYSWAQIAGVLGVSRAAVQKRWGHVGGVRQAGGQPGSLR